MNRPLPLRRVTMIFPVLALLLFFAVLAPAAASDFTFSSPEAGSTYRIGDVLRIQFSSMDTSVRLFQDMIGFSINNGKSWMFFDVALNGEDSISLRKQYDWVIPDSVTSVRTGTVSAVSDSCRICIAYYQTRGSRGASELFSIRNTAASSIASSRKSFFALRPDITNAKLGIKLTRTAINGSPTCFSVDGRLQRIVVSGSGRMPGVRRGTGIIIIP